MRMYLLVALLLTCTVRTTFAEYWVQTFDKDMSIDTDSFLRKDSTLIFWSLDTLGSDRRKIYQKVDCELLSTEVQQMQESIGGGSFNIVMDFPNKGKAVYYPRESRGGHKIDAACRTSKLGPAASLMLSPEAIRSYAKDHPINLVEAKDQDGNWTFSVNINGRAQMAITGNIGNRFCFLALVGNRRAVTSDAEISKGGVAFAGNNGVVEFYPLWKRHGLSNGFIELSNTDHKVRWTSDEFEGERNKGFAIGIAKDLYRHSSDAVLVTGGEGLESRNSAVGFDLLWDRAVRECGFPELNPNKKGSEWPKTESKKKIM
jgi:hypothetical protein